MPEGRSHQTKSNPAFRLMSNSEDYVASIIRAGAPALNCAEIIWNKTHPKSVIVSGARRKLRVIKRAAPTRYKPANVKSLEWSS
jgi:hypothetical protein